MSRIYINPTLEKSIKDYCSLNGIEDINAFANRCAMQGFNIVKFGTSPKDNIERENNGIKDISKNAKNSTKNKLVRENEKKQGIDGNEKGTLRENHKKEENIPIEKKKENITVRKIQIIKKA